MLKNFFAHLHTVNTHRFHVCRLCFMMGLYRRGLMHDLSKYHPIEFISSVHFFQGNRSPIDAEKKAIGYSKCWLHHMHHNQHHWQYWVDFGHGEMVVYDPPIDVIREMVADRISACIVYQKEKYHPSSALEFLENSRERKFIPQKTYQYLHHYLSIVAKHDNLKDAMKEIKNDRTTF